MNCDHEISTLVNECSLCGRDVEDIIATQQARIEALEKGLQTVAQLIEESSGVSGLHMNGDVAPWSDLQTGGRFEEWLVDFDAALLQEPTP